MAERKMNVHVLFTENELNEVEKSMRLANIRNRSAYIRLMALNGYVIQLDPTDIRNLITQQRRLGNNLNQYARIANATGNIYKQDITDLQIRFEKIFEEIRKLEEKMAQL